MENSASTIDAPEKPLPLAMAEKPQTLAPAVEILPTPAPKEKEDTLHWLNRALKIAAYPIAGLSGLLVAANDLHGSAYKKAQSVLGDPFFGKIHAKHKPLYKANAEQYERRDKGGVVLTKFFDEEMRIKNLHSPAVGMKMKELGFSEEFFGLKDIVHKWKYVNRGSKQQAVVNGMTVAGIAIGALLTMAGSKTLIEMFSGKEEKDQEKAR